MPTYGEWQDGLEHQLLLKWVGGVVEVYWETESSIAQPEIGWEIGSTDVAFEGTEGRTYAGLGNANAEPSEDAWAEAQVDTTATASGGSLNVTHTGSVDVPVGGGFYNQTDGWVLTTTDAHLTYDQTSAFENPTHFLPPAETWPANATDFEIEEARFREVISFEVSLWDGLFLLNPHYEGRYKDFGESAAGWPDNDIAASPTTFRGHNELPVVPSGGFIDETWIPLDTVAAQAVVDAAQAGSTPDPDDFAMVGWVHIDEWPGVWGDVDFDESPGLPDVWFRIRFRTCRYRFIYDAPTQPPLVGFPRDDGLTGGAPRGYPPPKSRQRSNRTFGGYI